MLATIEWIYSNCRAVAKAAQQIHRKVCAAARSQMHTNEQTHAHTYRRFTNIELWLSWKVAKHSAWMERIIKKCQQPTVAELVCCRYGVIVVFHVGGGAASCRIRESNRRWYMHEHFSMWVSLEQHGTYVAFRSAKALYKREEVRFQREHTPLPSLRVFSFGKKNKHNKNQISRSTAGKLNHLFLFIYFCFVSHFVGRFFRFIFDSVRVYSSVIENVRFHKRNVSAIDGLNDLNSSSNGRKEISICPCVNVSI